MTATVPITLSGAPSFSGAGSLGARPVWMRGTESQQSFRDVLGVSRSRTPPAPPGADAAERARVEAVRAAESRAAAEQLVARVFVEPVLASVRENSQAAPPFVPTPAEKQFRAFADARIALDVVRSARLPIVDRLARDLLA